VAYYNYESGSKITPKIYQSEAGKPSDLLWAGNEYEPEGAGWIEIAVNPKVNVERRELYWILFDVEDQTEETYPIGIDNGPPENNADKINLTDGDGWERLQDYNYDSNWLIEVQVEYTTD